MIVLSLRPFRRRGLSREIGLGPILERTFESFGFPVHTLKVTFESPFESLSKELSKVC